MITDLGTAGDWVYAVGIQADGKIVAAGQGAYPSSLQLVRYNPDGSVDPTFGNAGGVVTAGTSNGDGIKTLLIRPGGKILAGGTKGAKFTLVQYNPDGSLDPTFGTNGIVTQSDFGAGVGLSVVSSLVIRPDGKILAGGYAYDELPGIDPYGSQGMGDFDFVIAQYLPNGTLDTAFATGGMLTLDVAGTHDYDEVYSMFLQPAGTTFKILLGGYTGATQQMSEFAMVRLTADGSIDTSFGQNGRVISAYGGGMDIARSLLVQPDGRIVLAGTTNETATGGDQNFRVSRYLVDGAPDPSFGGGTGTVITNFSGPEWGDWARAAFLQCDQKIVVGGYQGQLSDSGGLFFDFILARYNPDGSLDAGFGTGGKVVTSFTSAGEEFAFAIAPQKDGKFVVGGAVGNDGFAGDFALARYEGVENSADVQIAMTDTPDPVSAGQPLRYAIDVQHLSGSQCAFDVTVTDTIPSTMSLISASASQGTCQGTTTVTCQLGPLMIGQTATVLIAVTPTATGTYRNEASVTSTTPDPNLINNQVRVSTTVQ